MAQAGIVCPTEKDISTTPKAGSLYIPSVFLPQFFGSSSGIPAEIKGNSRRIPEELSKKARIYVESIWKKYKRCQFWSKYILK
jgi:hypothetical protein